MSGASTTIRTTLKQASTFLLVARMVFFFSATPLTLARDVDGQPQQAVAYSQAFSPEQFLAVTNYYRGLAGVAPLTLNDQLVAAAEAKAEDMAAKGYWDHFRPVDHKAPWDFIQEAGYSYRVAGENLARGFRTPEGITRAWMASPTHQANLLSPKYQEVGFACIQVSDQHGQPLLLTVQMFGSR